MYANLGTTVTIHVTLRDAFIISDAVASMAREMSTLNAHADGRLDDVVQSLLTLSDHLTYTIEREKLRQASEASK